MLACQQAVDTRGNYIVIAELTSLNQRVADGRRDEFLTPVIDDAAGDATWQIEDGFQGSADNSIAFTWMCVDAPAKNRKAAAKCLYQAPLPGCTAGNRVYHP